MLHTYRSVYKTSSSAIAEIAPIKIRIMAITQFKVLQGHRFRNGSKARMLRRPISEE